MRVICWFPLPGAILAFVIVCLVLKSMAGFSTRFPRAFHLSRAEKYIHLHTCFCTVLSRVLQRLQAAQILPTSAHMFYTCFSSFFLVPFHPVSSGCSSHSLGPYHLGLVFGDEQAMTETSSAMSRALGIPAVLTKKDLKEGPCPMRRSVFCSVLDF